MESSTGSTMSSNSLFFILLYTSLGRDHNKNVSSFKSDLFSASSATIFVESNGIQAGNIAKSSKKMVLYPEEGIIYEREYAE